MEIRNAIIESTSLGELGRGFSAFLNLKYGGSSGQGFGGFALGKDYTHKFIQRVLETVGVEKWEDLPGQNIRVEREDGWNGRILRIGNFLEEKWFDPTNL